MARYDRCARIRWGPLIPRAGEIPGWDATLRQVSEEVVCAIPSCGEKYRVPGPEVRLRKASDSPCLTARPARGVRVPLVRQLGFDCSGVLVKVHDVDGGGVGSDVVEASCVGVRSCYVSQLGTAELCCRPEEEVKV